MRKLKNEELNRLRVDEFKSVTKHHIFIILDNVRSLNNIGSVFRTADAFLIEGIYLCGITATPPNKEIHKTALGATESVFWQYFENTLDAVKILKKKGFKIIAVEQTTKSIMLQDFKPEADVGYALVFGHEIKGVEQEVIDHCSMSLEIPQYGTKHSFNIAVSVGIVLWDLINKWK
ncbi:MAG: RNA methyltransferase [Bacteroidales bacterium]|nr:RNA methyltransferase [Bacteroidales bacterium]